MDDSLLVDDLDSLDHLDCDVQASLEVELPPALLELVLETLAEEVHNHNVVHLAVVGLLVADKVQVGHGGLASELVDELALPEKHDVLCIFDSLLDLGSQEVARLSLLDLVDLSEGATSQLLNDLVPLVKNLLSFFHT